MNTQINRGVAALKEGAQSLWYPYVHSKNGPKNDENDSVEGTKFTTNYHNGRLKNGELVLAVARQVMLDYRATVESLSALLEVNESSVKKALKKIRDRISARLAIPGLNDVEMDNLARAMAERASFFCKKNSNQEKQKSIIQDVCYLIWRGKSVQQIAEVVGLSVRNVKKILVDSGFDMWDLAKNLIWGEGYSISEASSHLGLKAKEVTERLIGERLFGEIIYRMVVERDLSIGEIVKSSGFNRKEFMQKLKEHGHGNILIDLARFLSRIGHDAEKISNLLGISREKVEKATKCGTIVRAKDIKVLKVQRHSGISMMKPGKPKNNKEKKRPPTISRVGLAEWCMQHYDKDGILRLPKGCRAPADLPRKYPTPKMELFLPEEPKPTFIPAPPLSKAECTVRGRNRIGYMRLF